MSLDEARRQRFTDRTRALRMTRRLGALVVVVCTAATLAAQRPRNHPPVAMPSHAPARAEQPVPFAVGETLVYDVSWSSFATAGEASLTVKEKKPAGASTAYYIVADGRPNEIVSRLYALYYKVDTLLDAFNLLPRRASSYSEEGRQRRVKATIFDQGKHTATFEAGQPPTSRSTVKVPPLTQDGLSALYVLRVLRLTSGQRLSMPVMNDGDLYRAGLTTGARERIQCGLGAVQAMRVDMKLADAKGRPVGNDMAVWLTAGQRQVPVQMKADLPIGSFRLLLREARGLLPDARR